MLSEIINPSDPYTLVAERFDVDAAACLFLGQGQYGLQEINGEQHMPVFIFGGAADWFKETFQVDLREFFEQNLVPIAECLDSVLIGSGRDREAYEQALALIPDEAGKNKWRESWHDKRCSSMNDIGARARRLADMLRKKADALVEGAGRMVITTEQALAMLPDGDQLHTARQNELCLLGADWDRSDLEQWVRTHVIELTGPEASSRGYGMAGKDEGGWLFIKTKEGL